MAQTKKTTNQVAEERSKRQHDFVASFGGGALFYTWQLGAIKAFKEMEKLENVSYAGCSAGAITAALLICGVDPEYALRKTYDLAVNYGAYQRKRGVVGILGKITRSWLEEILPENAAILCNGKLFVHITRFRGYWKPFKMFRISSFRDRENLIDVLMASAHFPWYMDGSPFVTLSFEENGTRPKVRKVMDGAVIGWLPAKKLLGISKRKSEITVEVGRKPDIHISHEHDESLKTYKMKQTKALPLNEAMELFKRGYAHTRFQLEQRSLLNFE